jgi:hypothetical protein
MTTTHTRMSLWRRTWVRVTASIGALALGAGVGAAGAALASPRAAAIRPAANSAPAHPKAKAPTAAPRSAHSTPPPGPAGYATDILQAGITAPVVWINSTGQKIVADWRAGYTAAWTDQNVLLPGGIYQYHLATFDQITARDFGVTPPAQGIEPAAPAQPAQQPTSPQLTNGVAVVLQYYQDLNNRDYSDAWNLGGSNLNGEADYDQWVAGYDTTASISVTASGVYDDGTVWTHISATQTDGTVRTYDGTYTVANGVIVSASITQTS